MISDKNILIIILFGLMSSCLGKNSPSPPLLQNIAISISNRDMTSPVALMSVVLDDEVIFKGAVTAARNGQYTYLVTRTVADRGLSLLVTSETDKGRIEQTKEVWVREGIWIVISRENNQGDEARLDISLSYENGSLP